MDLLAMLKEGGGWGLSVILMGVIVYQEKAKTALHERIFGLLNNQHEILKAIKASDDVKKEV